jgi:hypothetical protein
MLASHRSFSGKFNWAAMDHLGIQQAVNLLPAAVSGGVSGVIPTNMGLQLVEDFGGNLGQTELDDRLFAHRNLNRDDRAGHHRHRLEWSALLRVARRRRSSGGQVRIY